MYCCFFLCPFWGEEMRARRGDGILMPIRPGSYALVTIMLNCCFRLVEE